MELRFSKSAKKSVQGKKVGNYISLLVHKQSIGILINLQKIHQTLINAAAPVKILFLDWLIHMHKAIVCVCLFVCVCVQ